MDKQWISIADAAVRLRLSYNQVFRLVLVGELQGERHGPRWFVSASSVERFLETSATA